MGQLKWTYLDDFDRRYDVGIYHGDRSGHVVIYINQRIVVIDFNVFEDRKYSFYINEELCDIEVDKMEQGYGYNFQVNTQADTPLNRARKIRRKAERKKFALGMVAILVIFSIYALILIKLL